MSLILSVIALTGAMVLGRVSVCMAVLSFIFAKFALKEGKDYGNTKSFARAGIIIGIVALLVFGITVALNGGETIYRIPQSIPQKNF